jgi:hypothetical protein
MIYIIHIPVMIHFNSPFPSVQKNLYIGANGTAGANASGTGSGTAGGAGPVKQPVL